MFAVFDGHLGDSASDFAAKSIRERFLYRVNSRAEVNKNAAHFNLSSSSVLQLLIFEEALRGAITDIDTDFRRVNGYQRNGMASGSTAAVALKVGDQLLVANVGDSRAVIAERRGTDLVAVDLSSDQTPFRSDECARVKLCGARVLTLDQLEGLKNPNVQCWGGEEDDDGDGIGACALSRIENMLGREVVAIAEEEESCDRDGIRVCSWPRIENMVAREFVCIGKEEEESDDDGIRVCA